MIIYKYYIVIILYFKSCYIFKAKEFDFIILTKNYYNIIRKMVFNKDKLKIINNLFIIL